MRVLVTGGTGFIGRQLVAALVARGDEVAVVSRARADLGGVAVVPWDELDLDGSDAVVHLAGAALFDARWGDARKAELRRSRVETGARLAEAIVRAARKPGVFVSGSAVGYYGGRTDAEACAEGSAGGSDFLAALCADWEAAAQPAREAGVRVTHPRLGVVLGEGGGALSAMMPIFRLGLGGRLGSGTQVFPWVHARDVVRALLFMIDKPDLHGPVNVVAPGAATMAEFTRALGAALRRPAVLPVPGFALRLVLGERADALLTGQLAPPTVLTREGFEFEFPTLDRALPQILGSS